MNTASSSLAETFRRGLGAHQSGRLQEAEAAYRQVLASEPSHPDTLHLLGVLAHQTGHSEAAAELIGRAIGHARRRADFHCNLGLVLNALGRPEEATAALKSALRLKPDYPDALNSLGIAQAALGRSAAAEASYRKAIRLQPGFVDALNNLGLAQMALGRPAEAEATYRKALRLDPRHADAQGNLGISLSALGRPEEAEASYREALRLRPQNWDCLNNLGVLLTEQGRLAEAETSLVEAVGLRPERADSRRNLGVVLTRLGRAGEAETILRETVAMVPADADAHFNLGAALHDLRRMDEAVASYREALRLQSGHAEVHGNLAYALLLRGEFEEGWREHEWRWRTRHMLGGERDFVQPRWNGEALDGRTLLLHAEQGLGDTLQFCRYAAIVAAGGRVILEVQPPLKRLMCSLEGIAEVIARGETLPDFNTHAPLLSLPFALGTTLESVPADIPYLATDPAAAAFWRERLAAFGGLKVGLAWAGEPKTGYPELAAVDRRRSIALAALAPLFDIKGVNFVSLQKGAAGAQAAGAPISDFTGEIGDFADTAALVDGLDLVISVDTSVAHLAGAMGKPVWLLNRFDTCWRWLESREDSPWYPSLRQFRQTAPHDWAGVVARVRDALIELAEAS
ncbi:MAG TPA: tetratricopeptide repeat protein [Caulobacteraceae bacterium]|nr:tetratricopeptide repeat protein [Caulobacteraceae bacterium]